MRKGTHHKNTLIVAIAPSSRGFGFAVLEGGDTLIDWGVTTVKGDKNAASFKKVEKMLAHYGPKILVLADASAKGSRRYPRIRKLTKKITALASSRKITVTMFGRSQVMQTFFEDGKGTKHTVARILALRFREELGHRLPPKRKHYKSEDYCMGIFDAVALAMTHVLHNKLSNGN